MSLGNQVVQSFWSEHTDMMEMKGYGQGQVMLAVSQH